MAKSMQAATERLFMKELLLYRWSPAIERASKCGSLTQMQETPLTLARMWEFGEPLQFAKPSFILVSSGLHADGEEIVKGIQSITGQDTAIFGGLAGDDKEFKTTFCLYEW